MKFFLVMFLLAMPVATMAQTTYHRDASGRIVGSDKMIDGTLYHYDANGRIIGSEKQINGVWYRYDANGRIIGQ